MVNLKGQGRPNRAVFVIWGGILLLFAAVMVGVFENSRRDFIGPEANKETLNWMALAVAATAGGIETDADKTIPVLLARIQTELDMLNANLNRSREAPKASLNDVTEARTAIQQGFEVARMESAIREMTKLLKRLSTENGLDLDVLYESIEETATQADEMQDKVERLKVLMDVNHEIAEKLAEGAPPKGPVMKTWFESGSIILKVLVVNPSKTETQTIPVKVDLPKEVGPNNIMDLGELKLDYDPEQEIYSINDEVTLGPGQSIVMLVEMEDIWLFEEEQLSSLVHRAKKISGPLEKTPYADEATNLVLGIERKVKEILERQESTSANAGEHIQAYQQGITIIATIEEDLSALHRLEDQVATLSTESQGENGAMEITAPRPE